MMEEDIGEFDGDRPTENRPTVLIPSTIELQHCEYEGTDGIETHSFHLYLFLFLSHSSDDENASCHEEPRFSMPVYVCYAAVLPKIDPLICCRFANGTEKQILPTSRTKVYPRTIRIHMLL